MARNLYSFKGLSEMSNKPLFFFRLNLLEPLPSILTLQLDPVFSTLKQCLSVYVHFRGFLLTSAVASTTSSVTILIGDWRLPSSATGNSLCQVWGPKNRFWKFCNICIYNYLVITLKKTEVCSWCNAPAIYFKILSHFSHFISSNCYKSKVAEYEKQSY